MDATEAVWKNGNGIHRRNGNGKWNRRIAAK